MSKQQYAMWTVLGALCGVSALAQVPETFHYQGRYVKEGGLANGDYPVIFELTDAAAAGQQLYAETQLISFVDGFFDAEIGTSAQTGTLKNAFGAPSVFLQITIDGETLTPSEKITSVPYALLAGGIDGPLDMNGEWITNARYRGDGAGLTNLVDYVGVNGIQTLYGSYTLSNPLKIDVPVNYGHGPGRPTQLILKTTGADIMVGRNITVPYTAGGLYIGDAITVGENSRGIAIGSSNSILGDTICIGYKATGGAGGSISVGHDTYANYGGTAMGHDSIALLRSVAFGQKASGGYDGTALGYYASAGNLSHPDGSCRVAIGTYATNQLAGGDSAVIRGSHYADGGTGIYFRATFGSGEWAGLYTDGTNLFFKNTAGATQKLTNL